jgi:hypothetical protein
MGDRAEARSNTYVFLRYLKAIQRVVLRVHARLARRCRFSVNWGLVRRRDARQYLAFSQEAIDAQAAVGNNSSTERLSHRIKL